MLYFKFMVHYDIHIWFSFICFIVVGGGGGGGGSELKAMHLHKANTLPLSHTHPRPFWL
jgi:hypothetical protein